MTADKGLGERRRGRPVTTGTTPKRDVRVGAVWDEAAAIARINGETIREVIERALRLYVRRHAAGTTRSGAATR